MTWILSSTAVLTYNLAGFISFIIYHVQIYKERANYPKELAQDAAYRSHTSRLTGLWFLPNRPKGWIPIIIIIIIIIISFITIRPTVCYNLLPQDCWYNLHKTITVCIIFLSYRCHLINEEKYLKRVNVVGSQIYFGTNNRLIQASVTVSVLECARQETWHWHLYNKSRLVSILFADGEA
jgi:hypothetical protein